MNPILRKFYDQFAIRTRTKLEFDWKSLAEWRYFHVLRKSCYQKLKGLLTDLSVSNYFGLVVCACIRAVYDKMCGQTNPQVLDSKMHNFCKKLVR